MNELVWGASRYLFAGVSAYCTRYNWYQPDPRMMDDGAAMPLFLLPAAVYSESMAPKLASRLDRRLSWQLQPQSAATQDSPFPAGLSAKRCRPRCSQGGAAGASGLDRTPTQKGAAEDCVGRYSGSRLERCPAPIAGGGFRVAAMTSRLLVGG